MDNLAKGVARNAGSHTLPSVGHAKVRYTKLLHILLENPTLCAGIGFINECLDGCEVLARGGPEGVSENRHLYDKKRLTGCYDLP